MPQIDTTKPLALVDDPREVTFITETSDDNILVSITDTRASWHIFDKQGNFVRSESSNGCALKLCNKEVEKTLYVRVSASDISRVQTSISVTEPRGSGVAAIKLTVKDGVVVAAELARSNEARYPFKVIWELGRDKPTPL